MGDGEPRSEDLALERGDILFVDQFMVDGGHRVLPDQFLGRDLRAEIARAGAHVAVGQLEPRPGKRVRKRFRVFVEALRNRFIDGIHPQREVRRGHDGRNPLRRIVGGRREILFIRTDRHPLPGAGGAFHQIPIIAEQHVEIAHVPLGRFRRPRALDAAADRVVALAPAEAALPAEALVFDAGRFGLGPHIGRRAGAMAFAEGVAAGDERDGLFVVHGHAGEGLAHVTP